MSPIIKKDEPLAPYTTLGVGGPAQYFVEVGDEKDLYDVLLWAKEETIPFTILGGGSNVLIGDDGIQGLVIRPIFSDISYDAQDEDVYVTAGAGLVLDVLIQELVEKEFWGLENLTSIPGTVGGVPIQNVGAYGTEARDIVYTVKVFDTETFENKTLTNEECQFAYRDSIFKKEDGKKYFVTHVTFKVSKKPKPNIAYKDIENFFAGKTNPTIQEIRDAISAIRKNKFPDWGTFGTAGSFFKNPIISSEQYTALQSEYPDIPGYGVDEGLIKVPLGWILDHVCNLKGHKVGNVGLYEKQALVLVCEKGTHAQEIISFADEVAEIVFRKTKIKIENEVTFLL